MRLSSRRIAVVGVLSAGIAVGAPVAAATACKASWAGVPSFGANGFVAVDAVSSTDVWAVGKSSITAPVAHFDGTSWRLVSAPARRHRTVVEARAPDDVWTVAKDTNTGPNSIEHFDGASWTTTQLPREVELTDFAALARDDVWGVGSASDGTGTRTPSVWHWDGARWQAVANVTRGDFATTYAGLQSVAALAPDDVWAVGMRAVSDLTRPTEGDKRTVIEHWDGSRWALVASPQPDASSGPYNLAGLAAVAADDIWAVGDTGGVGGPQRGLIEHWDGAAWTVVPSPQVGASSRLYAVAAVSADDVWAVGEAQQPNSGVETLIEHWDGTSWTVVGPTFAGRRFVAASATADGSVFAAGGALYDLCEVRVLDDGVVPAAATKIPLGVEAAWSFAPGNGASHGVADALGLGLFDSGLRAPGGSFTYAFPAAGAFPVVDRATGRTSTIGVSIRSGGRQITAALTAEYTLRWGLGSPPPGAVYDVQIKRLVGGYTDFLVGTTTPGMTFTPATLGCTCTVRARLRNAATGAASGWSSAVRIDP